MSPTVKLLATDLDGTLLFDNQVSAADIAALRSWRRAGNLLTTATGRSQEAARAALEGTGLEFDYHVLISGAVVRDGAGGVIHSKYVPADVVAEVLQWLRGQERIAVFATTAEGPYQLLWSTVPQEVEQSISFHHNSCSPRDLEDKQVVCIPVWAPREDPGEIAAMATRLEERFGHVVDVHQNQDFIDLVPKDCSKGTGLELVANRLRQEGKQVLIYTMGDSFNDVPMHQIADEATAFAHSPLPVQQEAGRVSASVAEFVEHLLGR